MLLLSKKLMSLLSVPMHLCAEQTRGDVSEINKGLQLVFNALEQSRDFPVIVSLRTLNLGPRNLNFVAKTLQEAGYVTRIVMDTICLSQPSVRLASILGH